MSLQVVIVIVHRFMRAARSLRLVPTVITTAPLWLLPLLAVLPALESYKLKRVDGWPDRGAPAHAQLKLAHLKDAFTDECFPQPNAQVPVINLNLHELLIDELNQNLPLSGFVEKRGTIETAAGYQRINLRYQGDNAYHWFYPKKSWRLETKKTQPLEIGRKLSLINPKDS